MASICSVTFIDPSSAPMPAPARPLTTRPVITGPLSFMIENTIMAGRSDLAPKRTMPSRVSNESTTPVAAPAKATKGSDIAPIASHCRTNSRHSYGGVTAALARRAQNKPSSPNHSKPDRNNPPTPGTLPVEGQTRRNHPAGRIFGSLVHRIHVRWHTPDSKVRGAPLLPGTTAHFGGPSGAIMDLTRNSHGSTLFACAGFSGSCG